MENNIQEECQTLYGDAKLPLDYMEEMQSRLLISMGIPRDFLSTKPDKYLKQIQQETHET